MNSTLITEDEGKERKFGSFSVSVISNYFVPTRDGTRLSIRVWFPESNVTRGFPMAQAFQVYKPNSPSECEKYPAILEFIPYRKSDYTANRDHRRHLWFASHGYIVVRGDLRGSGESDGYLEGEYLPLEQEDCCDLIAWLADLPCCNGRVGMYGKSWSGFNGLQVAYVKPPALKAVISLYSTDDRFSTDIYWDGGCVIGHGLLSWAMYMFCFNARCPDPRIRNDWKEVWQNRLQKASNPWAKVTLSHQTKDDYWMHGSICQDPQQIQCPVLAIGGYRDGYTDVVLRLVESLPATCCGIVGPWAHDWPDQVQPGPNMDFLVHCLQWWNCHLKEENNSAMNQPKLQMYVRDSEEPNRRCTYSDGHWLNIAHWPPKLCSQHHTTQIFQLSTDNILNKAEEDPTTGTVTWKKVPYDSTHGVQGPAAWLSFGGPDAADDQTQDDDKCLCWTSKPLDEAISIAGFPTLELQLKINNHTGGVIVARLCDVLPDGRSNLVTYGVLNLTHRNGSKPSEVSAVIPGKETSIRLQMHVTGYIIPKNHKLRLSLSSNWWPHVWPASKIVDMEVKCLKSKLTLPNYSGGEKCYDLNCSNPSIGPSIPSKNLRQSDFTIHNDYSEGLHIRTVVCDFGREWLTEEETIMEHSYKEIYQIRKDDPLSAKMKVTHHIKNEWPNFADGLMTEVLAFGEMWADEKNFYLHHDLKVLMNNNEFFSRSWNDVVKRECV